MRNGLLAIALAMSPLIACAQMYKWVDENGHTQFADRPPPDGVKFTVINAPTPAPNQPVATPSSVSQQEIEFRRRRVQAAEKQRDEDKKQQERQALAERCTYWQGRLTWLSGGGPVYESNKDGGRDYLSDETREAEKLKARQGVEQSCK
jgi:hypothetical protein